MEGMANTTQINPDTKSEGSTNQPVVAITDGALELARAAVNAEESSETLALWVEISGISGNGFSYDIYFSELSSRANDDTYYEIADVPVVIPSGSVKSLQGASLDVSESADGPGLVMVNPNKPTRSILFDGLDLENPRLDSPVAREILEVLETQVNPSIASHGGSAQLVAVAPANTEVGDAQDGSPDDLNQVLAYVKLSGGCQGCAMSRATLSQGIEVAIKESIPQVVGVIDVTDHASGANPYF